MNLKPTLTPVIKKILSDMTQLRCSTITALVLPESRRKTIILRNEIQRTANRLTNIDLG